MKIKNKINLTFFLLFTAVTIFSVTIMGIMSSRVFKNQIYQSIKLINNSKANAVRIFLNSEKEVVGMLAASTLIRDFLEQEPASSQYLNEKDRVAQRLDRSIKEVPQIYELFILNRQGEIISSTDKTNEGLIRINDDYFTKAQDEIFIKDLYNSETTKHLSYTVSAPIKDSLTGETLGVVVARMNPDNLFKTIGGDSDWSSTGENFLVNHNKFLISPSRFNDNSAILDKIINTKNVEDCFNSDELALLKNNNYANKTEKMVDYTDYRGKSVISVHSFIPETNWCLITKIDQTEVLAPIKNLSLIFASLSALFVLIFLLISLFISKKIIKPINDLKRAINNFKGGNFDYKITATTKDEVGDLARSFSDMAIRIKKIQNDVDNKIKEQTIDIIKKNTDIENQKKALLNILEDIEQEKTRSDALAGIVKGAEEAIVGENLEGKIITWNRGAEKLYGYGAEEVIGKSIKIIFPDNRLEELNNIIKATKNNTPIDHYQTQRKKKDGSIVDIALSVSPINDQEGKIVGFSAISFDVSKERQIDRAKTEFVSLASHQLRTPLSSINWYAEMLLAGDAGKLSAEQANFVQEIYAGNQRMVELVNALLNVSRLELGTFVVEPESVNITKSAESVLKELQPMIKKKNTKISFNYDKDLPPLEADPKLIRIILQNLLSNAVKYTPEKGIVNLTITKNTKNILIKVSDNGYGITKSQQDKIFDKLFRADNVKAKDTEGTGLGLYIVKSIINQTGGKITFESEENKGTTFFVELPLSGMKKKAGNKSIE